jgi:hypothetical protein
MIVEDYRGRLVPLYLIQQIVNRVACREDEVEAGRSGQLAPDLVAELVNAALSAAMIDEQDRA